MTLWICLTVYVLGIIAYLTAAECYDNSTHASSTWDILFDKDSPGYVLLSIGWPAYGPLVLVVLLVYAIYKYALYPLVKRIASLVCPHAE